MIYDHILVRYGELTLKGGIVKHLSVSCVPT